MVTAFQILRIGLLLATVFLGLILFSELTGRAIYDDWRLARAIVEDHTASTDATRRELEAATVANRYKRLTVGAVEFLLFAAGCSGIFFTTRAIRARVRPSREATPTI